MNWEFYKDKRNKWRWRAVNRKNKIIEGASTQGYASKTLCLENGNKFKKSTVVWKKM